MAISIAQINALPTSPTKDWPTHLQDHATVHLALQEYVPLVVSHAATIPALAPIDSPRFTGAVAAPALTVGSEATVGQVLTAVTTGGSAAWVDPAVASVAGRTGTITLGVTDISGAAPIASPQFTGSVSTPAITISGGATPPATGMVLTAENVGGGAVWAKAIPSGAALPTGSEDLRGTLFLLEGAVGTDDTLHVCLRQASGQFEWRTVTAA